VAAALALTNNGGLVDLRTVLKLGNPLPGVFLAVSEERVGAVDLVSAAECCFSCCNIWVDTHVEVKDISTLICEVIHINVFRALLMEFGCNLVPTELSAVLPSPLSA